MLNWLHHVLLYSHQLTTTHIQHTIGHSLKNTQINNNNLLPKIDFPSLSEAEGVSVRVTLFCLFIPGFCLIFYNKSYHSLYACETHSSSYKFNANETTDWRQRETQENQPSQPYGNQSSFSGTWQSITTIVHCPFPLSHKSQSIPPSILTGSSQPQCQEAVRIQAWKGRFGVHRQRPGPTIPRRGPQRAGEWILVKFFSLLLSRQQCCSHRVRKCYWRSLLHRWMPVECMLMSDNKWCCPGR